MKASSRLTGIKLGSALLSLAVCAFQFAAFARGTESPAPRRVRVLFLGDRGIHHPAERANQMLPVLGDRGIDLYYTEDLNDLNPSTLALYDCLLIYANHTAIQADQEKALLDYVASGHGLVAVHCASFCLQH